MSKVNEWLFGIAARKGATQAVVALLGLIGSEQLGGVDTTTAQKVLVAVILGVLNVLRNWLKVKVGMQWL